MFPKLKYARLCRILTYVTVIGVFLLPGILLIVWDMGSDLLGTLALILQTVGLLIYIIKNFALLMGLDITLATLHCYHIARRRYPLPRWFRTETVKKRIARYGNAFTPQSTVEGCTVHFAPLQEKTDL